MLLKNCQILSDGKLVKKDIQIKNNLIIDIADNITNNKDDETYDLKNNFLTTGFIDLHVHLREPGYSHKETIKTGSMAAAAGGYTTICAMPNTKPIMDNYEIINEFYQKVKTDSVIKIKTYCAITKNFDEDKLTDIESINNLVCGFSNDGVGIQNSATMYKAMSEVVKVGSFISAHCEDESLLSGGVMHEGKQNLKLGFKGITSLSESVQVARDIEISNATNCRYHVCHISTKETVEQIRQAKKLGRSVTCEVTPHHLILTENDVIDANFKMNPPLRSLEDRSALIEGIIDGTIDVIATDHAPHSEEEKSKGIKSAPFGIVGLETAFPLIYTNFVKTNLISLQQAVNLFALNPAKILGLTNYSIEKGNIADLTVIDLNTEKEIDKNNFYSLGKNTPFDKIKCSGFPVMTIVDGVIAFNSMEDLDE